MRYLQKHSVELNILCTVNAANEKSVVAQSTAFFVMRWERSGCSSFGSLSAHRRRPSTSRTSRSEQPGRKRLFYTQSGNLVTKRSVGGEQYGRFLVDIFEEWVRHDVGEVFVQMFDVTLEAYFGRHLLCIHALTCGYGPALEYNGDVYSCDHFVEPRYKLGNIHETHLVKLVAPAEQRKFGDDKRDSLTAQCQRCEVRSLCNGVVRRIDFYYCPTAIPARTTSGVSTYIRSSPTPPLRCRRWPTC